MKNKKAQLSLGAIMVVFITLIVGVVLFQVIAQESGDITDLSTLTEYTFTSAAAGDSIYLTDYKVITPTTVNNGTDGDDLSSNYTITNNAIDPTTGALAVQIETEATSIYGEETWSINGTAQRTTYVAGAAGSVTALIAIFFALAIALVALEPTLRSGVLNALGK